MSERIKSSEYSETLRKKSEEKAGAFAIKLDESLSPEEVKTVLHELHVHQIELEMQNDELRWTQEKLEASRTRYFNLYNQAPAGYLTLNKKGLITEANLAAANLVGIPRGAMITQPFTRFIFQDDLDLQYLRCKKLLETGVSQVYELRLLKKDGQPILVRVESAVASDSEGVSSFRVVLSDITDRKRAEEALKALSLRQNAILAAIPDIIMEVDSNKRYIWANNVGKEFFGDDVIGTEASCYFVGEQNTYEIVQPLYDGTGDMIYVESWQRRRDGEKRLLAWWCKSVEDENGKRTSWLSTARDITELKKAENELNLFFDLVPDMVCIATADGYFKKINKAWETVLGFSSEELLGTPIMDLIHPDDRTATLEEIEKQLAGEYTLDFSNRYLCKDGSYRWFDWKATPAVDHNLLFAAARDITERKKMEEENEKLMTQNLQLQKTKSLATMAGGIAHHFNNQLFAVMGNLDLALCDSNLSAETIEKLNDAMQAAEKAAEVSSLMLTYIGQSAGKYESLDLSDLCRNNLPLIKSAIPQNISFEVEFQATNSVIKGDAKQIQMALANLILNAYESLKRVHDVIHMTVKTVKLSEIPASLRFPLDWQPHGEEYACVEVLDTGCGIAEADMEKLFDPFFTTRFSGRGLGLSVVLGIVRGHGGLITVESVLGSGSSFRVFFPLTDEKIVKKSEKTAHVQEYKGDGTVLVVDDNQSVLMTAKSILETHMGFSVLLAHDGVEAVGVFKGSMNKIRLVICDLTMPNMDGWETITALRKLRPDVPVILASGYDRDQAMEGEHPEQPQVFLSKPYRLNDLIDAVDKALGQ